MAYRIDMKSKYWEAIQASSMINAYLLMYVDNYPVLFLRNRPGIYFAAVVPDDVLDHIASKMTVAIIKQQPKLAEMNVIGRMVMTGDKNIPQGYWPLTDQDTRLAEFMEKATIKFYFLINSYTTWPFFRKFLEFDISYQIETTPPTEQTPLEYWWLVGENGTKHLCDVSIYPDQGVFIRPENKKLPVFTSSLYADMAAVHYQKQYGVNLVPDRIHCLGCFLTGLTREAGSDNVKGAILNDQWKIDFYSCDQGHSHFFLIDNDSTSLALAGCADQNYGPFWADKKWDKEGKWFSPSCNPVLK